MLSKVDDATVSYNYNDIINVEDKSVSFQTQTTYTIFTNNYGKDGCDVSWSFYFDNPYSWGTRTFTWYMNNTQIFSWQTASTKWTYTGTKTLNKWEDLIIKVTTNTSWEASCSFKNIVLNTSGTWLISKTYNKINKLFTVKSIWQKINAYLFGRLPTGERRDGN